MKHFDHCVFLSLRPSPITCLHMFKSGWCVQCPARSRLHSGHMMHTLHNASPCIDYEILREMNTLVMGCDRVTLARVQTWSHFHTFPAATKMMTRTLCDASTICIYFVIVLTLQNYIVKDLIGIFVQMMRAWGDPS